jgi:hypothetical protein
MSLLRQAIFASFRRYFGEISKLFKDAWACAGLFYGPRRETVPSYSGQEARGTAAFALTRCQGDVNRLGQSC